MIHCSRRKRLGSQDREVGFGSCDGVVIVLAARAKLQARSKPELPNRNPVGRTRGLRGRELGPCEDRACDRDEGCSSAPHRTVTGISTCTRSVTHSLAEQTESASVPPIFASPARAPWNRAVKRASVLV